MSNRLSRRDLLRLGAGLAGDASLAACAPGGTAGDSAAGGAPILRRRLQHLSAASVLPDDPA